MIRVALPLALVLGLSTAAAAQETQDKEQLKKSILEKVAKRIDEENRRILERVSKIIDEELAKIPEKTETELDRRIAAIEKALKDLDAQRAKLLKDLDDAKKAAAAAAKGDSEDAIKADAKKKGPQDLQEAGTLFEEAMEDHNAKNFKDSLLKFKYIYYNFNGKHSIAGTAAYNVACGYALSGEKAKACDWLELSFKAGFNNFDHAAKDTDLDSIRDEAKYKRLMADR